MTIVKTRCYEGYTVELGIRESKGVVIATIYPGFPSGPEFGFPDSSRCPEFFACPPGDMISCEVA